LANSIQVEDSESLTVSKISSRHCMVNISHWKRYVIIRNELIYQLESIYKMSRYVLSLCIYADPNQSKPIAIVVPVESEIRSLAMNLSVASTEASLETLVENTNVLREVHTEMISIARSHGLRGVELIQAAVLVAEDWTPENVLYLIFSCSLTVKVTAHGRKEIEPESYC